MKPPEKDIQPILKGKTFQPRVSQSQTDDAHSGRHPDVYRTLLKTVPIPLFFRSISGEYMGLNPAFERFVGKSRSEIVGQNNEEFFPKSWIDKEIESDQEIVLKRKAHRYEWHFGKPMGGMQDVFVDKAPVMDDAGDIVGIAGAISDISDVRGLEEELSRSTYRLESLLNALPVAIVLIDPQTHEIVDLNPMAMLMLNYTREQLVGRKCKPHICNGETEQCPLVDPSMSFDRSEGIVLDSSGRQIPVLKSTFLTEIDNNELLLECFLDMSQQKALEGRLREMAEKDFLTGIFNRRHFIESAEREVSRSKRYNTGMSVAVLDIDWFKKINDQFGHAAGDMILKGVVDICQELLRDTDFIGRIGGEEFAAILIESNLDGALIVAERLRKSIESRTFQIDGEEIRCTISIGISELNPEKDTLDTLMKRADKALYEAKKAGRNRTHQG